MKTTAFKVFASFVAIVCLASAPVSRASPVLKSVSVMSENSFVEKQVVRQHKNLVEQNVVDLKPYDSMLIANEVVLKPAMEMHEPMVSQVSHRQRRSINYEEEEEVERELDDSSISASVDSKETVSTLPDPSNEIEEESQQSNEIDQESQQSNEIDQESQPLDEVHSSQQSDEVQSLKHSDKDHNSRRSDDFRKYPDTSDETYRVPQGPYRTNAVESSEKTYDSDEIRAYHR